MLNLLNNNTGDYLNDLRRLVNTIVSMSRNKVGNGFSILGCYLSDFMKKSQSFQRTPENSKCGFGLNMIHVGSIF